MLKYAFVGLFVKSFNAYETTFDRRTNIHNYYNVRNVRQDVINAQGYNKKILDIGCGLGFSTSSNRGSLGIDNNLHTIQYASTLFPKKKFEFGDVLFWESDEMYDVMTSMFYLHKNPRDVRQKIIQLGKKYATERIVIVDLSPDYEPNDVLTDRQPHLQDYLETCREDFSGFTEWVIVKNKIHMWMLELDEDVKQSEEVYDYDALMRMMRFYRPM